MGTALDHIHRQETAPVNLMPVGARLVLGNYCAGATASATSAAAGFPASGATDGNRTELVETLRGSLPHWLSSAAPSLGSPQVLTIDLGASRKANYFKLYFLKASRPLTYMLSTSPDNSTWTNLAGTTDIAAAGVTTSYLFSDPGTGVVTLRGSGDTTFLSFRYIKLTIYRMTTGGDPANCVELECYRKLLITDRVTGGEISRDLDYSLNDILASTAKLTVANRDKYFSVDYVKRTRDGNDFVNDELKPGIGMELFAGNDPVSVTGTDVVTHVTQNTSGTLNWGAFSPVITTGFRFGVDGHFTGLDPSNASSSHFFHIEVRSAALNKSYSIIFVGSTTGYISIVNNAPNGTHTYDYGPINLSVDHQFMFEFKSDGSMDLYVGGVFAKNLSGNATTSSSDSILFSSDSGVSGPVTRLWYSTPDTTVTSTRFSYDDGVVRLYTGRMDRITVNPGGREAVLEFRDSMKELIRRTFSGGLLASVDIGDVQKYLLNAANVSDYEMSVDPTAIVLATFFTTEETLLTSLRDLVIACGDATLYFDEYDNAVAKTYMAVALEHIFSSTSDFGTGATLQNVTNWSDRIQRTWFRIDDFADANFSANPVWTPYYFSDVTYPASHSWSIDSGRLHWQSPPDFALGDPPYESWIACPCVTDYGTWYVDMEFELDTTTGYFDVFLMAQTFANYHIDSGTGYPDQSSFASGYFLRYDKLLNYVRLFRQDGAGATPVEIGNVGAMGTGAHLLRVERDLDGTFRVYNNGSLLFTSDPDNTYTSGAYFGFHTARYHNAGTMDFWADNIWYSRDASQHGGTPSASQAVWQSGIVDQGLYITSEGLLTATTLIPSGTTLTFETATSADGVTWDAWVAVTLGSTIGSTARRYIKLRVTFNVPQDSAGNNADTRGPIVYDLTLNWNAFAGSVKVPGSSSRTLRYDDVITDIEQELTDVVGGSSAIANVVTAKAVPLVMIGADSDIQWQGTVQVPPVPIAPDAPLQVHNGDVLVYEPVLDAASDVSRMSGANPAAAAVVFAGGAAGTWKFTKAHPTRPVLEITVTADGTITGLTIIAKSYETAKYGLTETSQDVTSILAYGIGSRTVSSPWIHQNSVAKSIADKIVSLFAAPLGQLSNLVIRFTPSIKRGDRITVVDDNTAISRDFLIMGVKHNFAVSESGSASSTVLRVFSI